MVALRISEMRTDPPRLLAYAAVMAIGVDKVWFKEARIAAGFATDADLARQLGIYPSAYTNLMKGERQLKALEAQKLATLLKRPVPEITQALGREPFAPIATALSGYVAAADKVVIFDDADDGVEIATVHVPFMHYPGSFLQIRGESMTPRYNPGDVIGVRMNLAEANTIDSLVGKDVVAFTADEQTLLKRLEHGDREGRYTLLSVNPLVPPLLNVALQWAVPVDILIPLSR